jgi:enamine deaminase RidA (YjgF/YER057c/UK114 family)
MVSAKNDDIDNRLKIELLQLGFPNGRLPVLIPALGNYVDVVEVDKLLYLSSAAPQTPAGTFVKGRVPNEVSADQAVIAAKLACVRQINRLKTHLGDLKRVKKIVFVKGKIVTQANFTGHTAIVDGCSSFLVNVFGNHTGKHARASDGLISLPLNVTLEVEMIVERK